MSRERTVEEDAKVPLLDTKIVQIVEDDIGDEDQSSLFHRFWIETKKLWRIVGPAIFSRIASYSMFVVSQAFAGHIGDLELAAMAIATSVIVGLDFGFLVLLNCLLLKLTDIFPVEKKKKQKMIEELN